MPWYAYHRGGWQIAVDAVSKADAEALRQREFPDAIYDGEFTPIRMANGFSSATAFVTPKRAAQIHESIQRDEERARREYPWIYGDNKDLGNLEDK